MTVAAVVAAAAGDLSDSIKQLEKRIDELTLCVRNLQETSPPPPPPPPPTTTTTTTTTTAASSSSKPNMKSSTTKKANAFLSKLNTSDISLSEIPGVGVKTLEILTNSGYTAETLFRLVMKCDNLDDFKNKINLGTPAKTIYNSIIDFHMNNANNAAIFI